MPRFTRDQVFISYSHQDEKWLGKLQTMLKPLVRQNSISVWDDKKIKAGEKWEEEIQRALARANVAVLLVSPNFLGSDFIVEHELPPLLEAAKEKGLVIFWIHLKWCLYEETEIKDYQAAHDISKPLDSLSPTDQSRVLREICRKLKDATLETERSAAPGGIAAGTLASSLPGAGRTDRGLLSSTKSAFSNLPERNTFFTGREGVLTELQEALAAHGRAVLSGMGGIGKTQTAVEYAYRHMDEYVCTLWATADSREALLSSYVAIADLLNLPEAGTKIQTDALGALKRWFSSQKGWLLILDNAGDFDTVRGFLPSGKNGHVILTAPARAIGPVARRVKMQKMETEEGALFLLRRAKYIAENAPFEAASPADRAEAKKIAGQLYGLPLGLDQAAAYIEETACGLSGYLALYLEHAPKLLKERGAQASNHPEPVATTWALSFMNIEKAQPAAAELLRFCAFLHPDAIPEELFSRGATELGPVLGPAGLDAYSLNSCISEIRDYSLLRRDSNAKIFGIHGLVQTVLKHGMNVATQRLWSERAVRAVNRAFPKVGFTTWGDCERLLPQVHACKELISELGFEFPEAARLLDQAGSYLKERGRYKQAAPLYELALKIREKALEGAHHDVAESINNLAWLLKDTDRHSDAESLYRRALEIDEKRFGPEHDAVARDLNNLALLLKDTNRRGEAERLFRRALEIHEKSPGHPDVATDLSNLAWLLKDTNRYAEAEPLFRRALLIDETTFGSEHPVVARDLNHLAWLLKDTHRREEAERLFRRALAIDEKSSGTEHPAVARDLNSLALLLKDTNRCAEAAPLFERALSILENVLGPERPAEVATCLENYALCLRATNHSAEAEPLESRAEKIRAKSEAQRSNEASSADSFG
jgi:tetratricopeptide (TPR) repeat protein